jgi:hypothetical protein
VSGEAALDDQKRLAIALDDLVVLVRRVDDKADSPQPAGNQPQAMGRVGTVHEAHLPKSFDGTVSD